MSEPRVCCWEGQYRAVREFMIRTRMQLNSKVPFAVRHPEELGGSENILFMSVVGHPERVPEGLMRMLQARGAEMVYIDDGWARDRVRDRFYRGASYSPELGVAILDESAVKADPTPEPTLVRRVPEGTRDLDLEDV